MVSRDNTTSQGDETRRPAGNSNIELVAVTDDSITKYEPNGIEGKNAITVDMNNLFEILNNDNATIIIPAENTSKIDRDLRNAKKVHTKTRSAGKLSRSNNTLRRETGVGR